MPSLQSIRSRIGGIAKTKQITQSMRLVSTTKVYKAKELYQKTLPYYESASKLVEELSKNEDAEKHSYFMPAVGGKAAVLAISTERGLCGAYNMNVARETISLLRAKKGAYIIAVGSKVNAALRREGYSVGANYLGISELPIFEEAAALGTALLELYDTGQVNELYVIHTQFTSMLEQHTCAIKLLPYEVKSSTPQSEYWKNDPKGDAILEKAIPMYINAVLYKSMAESALCEQTSRVNSMDSAARNSDDLVAKLTLQYNQLRQESITNQMIEIASGAAAHNKSYK